jgi:prepilin-type N-terminal cleavage/methylation domain-containing protein
MRLYTRPRGFTLAEVIVTAIVALALTAIAVPQFTVGATVGTDGAAQLSVAAVAAADVTYYQSASQFTASSSALTAIDPSLTYVSASTASTGSTTVSVALGSGDTVLGLSALGANGTCWMMRRSLTPASTYDAPVLYASGTSSQTTIYPCTGASALAINSNTAKFTSSNVGLSWPSPLLLP